LLKISIRLLTLALFRFQALRRGPPHDSIYYDAGGSRLLLNLASQLGLRLWCWRLVAPKSLPLGFDRFSDSDAAVSRVGYTHVIPFGCFESLFEFWIAGPHQVVMGSFANVGQYNFAFIVELEIEHAVRHASQGRLFGISPLIEQFNCVALGFRTDHRKLAVGPSTQVDRHELSVAT
jgi:hypothetical protein